MEKRKNRLATTLALVAGLAGGYGGSEGARYIGDEHAKIATAGVLMQAERAMDEVETQLLRMDKLQMEGKPSPFMDLLANKTVRDAREKMRTLRKSITPGKVTEDRGKNR